MILYRHPIQTDGTPMAPPWLEGAAVVSVETQTHRMSGIGEAYQAGDRAVGWVEVGDHWEAQRVLPDLPIILQRKLNWALSKVVADAEGREWQVPVILTPKGNPAIITAMGKDWLPVYTAQQQRLLSVAQAARAALETREVPTAAACQWAAEALEAANHITVAVIQSCQMMDTHLAQNVLLAMTGLLDLALSEDGNHG